MGNADCISVGMFFFNKPEHFDVLSLFRFGLFHVA
jgi:hypothetical protein